MTAKLLALLVAGSVPAVCQQQVFGRLDLPYLPDAGKASFFDRFGDLCCPAKLLDKGDLIASRREIESWARKSKSQVRYLGTPRRNPEWEDFPALLQRIRVTPALSGLALFKGHAAVATVAELTGHLYFTFHPLAKDDTIPLRFKSSGLSKDGLAFLLMTQAAGSAIGTKRVKVRTIQKRLEGLVITITTADLNADGQVDVIRIARDSRDPDCDANQDECGGVSVSLGILHRGRWTVTGRLDPLQDGPAGF